MSIPRQFADRAIREALHDSTNLKELLEFVVGDLASHLDWSSVEYEDTRFLLPDLHAREADILCRIRVRTAKGNTEIHVCLLVEHQSEPEHGMALRMLHYGVCYWQKLWAAGPKDRTAMLPIVFFIGRRPWRHRRDLGELIQSPGFPSAQAPLWPVLYLNLAEHSAGELLRSKRAWHQALAVVRAEREKDVNRFAWVLGAAAQRIDELADADEKRHRRLLEFILRWATARRGAEEHEVLYQAAIRHVRPEYQEQIRDMSSKIRMTFEEAWEQKAKERYELGRAEGKAEGEAEGERKACQILLSRLLEKRFGSLSDGLRSRIEASRDIERLRTCIEQVLEISSPDDLVL